MKSAARNLFPKSARLFLKKDIDDLFQKGQSFISYPLRIVYLSDPGVTPPESGISILVSVPKKRIKLAVNRNRIKRLVRETYRLNKSNITDYCILNNKRLHVAFMYISNDIASYAVIEKGMLKALNSLCQKEKVNI